MNLTQGAVIVSFVRPFRALGCMAIAAVAATFCPPSSQAGLVEYVKKPDPAFTWKLQGKTTQQNATIYDFHLVSQVWQGIPWEHQLQIYQPAGTSPNSTMLLWNTGGHASRDNVALGLEFARKMKSPCAFLYGIPKQPLFDGKKEDTLICETFVRYLNTKDEDWPLLFPMVKSVVKAMDVLQAFSEQEWKQRIDGFIVSGASKRGWTTWLTAAADDRVKAIAPVVIDTLNMREQNTHQLEAFGKYSEEIEDYTSRGLIPIPNTPEAKRLWTMVDPYQYRERLTIPKFILNGNNDPYWTVDALNLYWDGLKGPKWVLYVPNAGHNLQQQYEDGHKDSTRAVNGLAAFVRHQINGNPMPQLSWKHEDVNGKLRLTVDADPPPQGARLWVAHAPTQDFRKSKWAPQTAQMNGKTVVGEVMPPTDGCMAFYAEVDYAIDGLKSHLSTQIRVAGKTAANGKQ
jgi:PhoPQ-activated pathogenicity-related protein